MKNVILQPCANPAAQKHLADTILKPVALDVIAKHVTATELAKLQFLYPDGTVPTWGSTAGEDDVMVSRWERMSPGDLVLFLWKRNARLAGTVTYTTRNATLARELWSLKNDQPFEYVFFLTDIETLQPPVPYAAIAAAAGYKANWNPLQLTVIADERRDRILEAIDWASDNEQDPREGSELDLRAGAALDPAKGIDAKGVRTLRREQGFLRKHLFGRRTRSTCGLCQREVPTQLLVVAHIKKRAVCTEVERCDYHNVVMPMCKLGCDDLYEHGFITVADGVIRVNSSLKAVMAGAALDYALSLEGQPCSKWDDTSAPYFRWHHNNATR